MEVKFSDLVMRWLKEEGFTHCFFLAGGGSMHLLDSASRYFKCIPFVHEVSAAIATEYFNESEGAGKAFCLVTTGPGLTNTVTAISGAWLESHQLLILAGQVKAEDLAGEGMRQRGIQELPGVEIVKSISKLARRLDSIVDENEFKSMVRAGETDRKGPVVLEICIDVSATNLQISSNINEINNREEQISSIDYLAKLEELVSESNRPLILIGGGVSRDAAAKFLEKIADLGVPVAATWAGADRVHAEYEFYAGRPNTFGMRWANIYLQQCDLLISVGSRLSLQQTGFNWQEFCPVGKIVMVDIDRLEILKGHPVPLLGIVENSQNFLRLLPELLREKLQDISEWQSFLHEVRELLPVNEECQKVSDNFVDPYTLIKTIESHTTSTDIFTPGTSGGTHTAFYQTFYNQKNQKIISNKGLASMGYGLAGAIGAALANPFNRIINFEGDGSFSQNTQELATVQKNSLNIKMFVINNAGYASIRTSQISYFNGNYLGCDEESGLGFPSWELLAKAYGIDYFRIDANSFKLGTYLNQFESVKPVLFEVIADPKQLYLPKIASSIKTNGKMISNPLHEMSPNLPTEVWQQVTKYLKPNSVNGDKY